MAIATGSLAVLVFSSDHWKKGSETGVRAIPFVDVEVLLSALTPSTAANSSDNAEFVQADSRLTTEVEGETHNIQIQIAVEPEAVCTGPSPQSLDFALTGPSTELPVAHAVSFNLIHAKNGTVIPAVWRGYLNATPMHILGGGGGGGLAAGTKRRRFQTMAD